MKQTRSCACPQEPHNKRQQILDAAYIVFSRKGYHLATVDEIIALADTGKGTVYNYFVNKEQLFYTLVKERSMPFQTILRNVLDSFEPPLQKLENTIKAFLEFYVANADLWRVVMYEVRGLGVDGYSNFTIEQRDKYQAWFTETIGVFEKVITEGKDKGVIRDTCHAQKAANAIFSVIVTSVFRNFVDNIDQTAHNITEFLLYGIAVD